MIEETDLNQFRYLRTKAQPSRTELNSGSANPKLVKE